MNEGIALDENHQLMVVFESAADCYMNDGGEHATDRIWKAKHEVYLWY